MLICGFILLLAQVDILVRQSALEQLQQRTLADLNRYALSLQQRLDRFKNLPGLLATHLELRLLLLDPDSKQLQTVANEHLESVNRRIGAAETYLLDRNGMTLAASNWNQPLSFVGGDYSFRPYFQEAVKGESSRYFALGTRSKRRGYYFGHPVERGGEVIGVVVVKIDLNDIEEDWESPETDLLVTDSDGIVYISTEPKWKFRAVQPLLEKDRLRIVRSNRYGDAELDPIGFTEREQWREGVSLVSLVIPGQRLKESYVLQRTAVPGAQFDVAILASTRPVNRQVWEMISLVAVIYLAAVLLGLVLLSRRRILRERERFKARELRNLEANEARIRAILDSTQAGLLTINHQGRVLSANRKAELLFGLSQSSFCDQLFDDVLHGTEQALRWDSLRDEVKDSVDEVMLECEAQRFDGSHFPVEIAIGLMPQHRGVWHRQHFIITVHDITERKEYERALREAQVALESRVAERTRDLTTANDKLREEIQLHKGTQNELIQTAKLAVLGQMSAGINHELNQPLTAIRAYADNAQQFLRMERLDPVAQNLREIGMLTQRMAQIIHPLKEFSRKTSGQAEPVCLKSVKDGAMSIMYGRLHRETVEVVWPDGLDRAFVLGDIVRIEQVMVNLLENAIQAMEQNETKQVDIRLEQQDELIVLVVHDNGPGISDAELARIFEPFYTTKKAGQGLGLGLSISHRIVASMNGELSVSNHSEGGAEFRLALPKGDKPALKEI
ncbi:ATP-binding protein [Neptunomonas sp. XY-337]|uniref:ATP-binding protein n=1 Tax=Neptunomonas sp. XY-337 TaxID=2561897 RepID=UPI001F106A29|nr:ATP-binding protein [Neptunomonas sp. XY-337]